MSFSTCPSDQRQPLMSNFTPRLRKLADPRNWLKRDQQILPPKWQALMKRTLIHKGFNILLVVAFTFALFGHDFFNVFEFQDFPSNIVLDVVMVATTAVFLIEFIMLCLVDDEYGPRHAAFWLDFIALVSMSFEISFVAGTAGTEDRPSDANKLVMVRSARAAKLGARAIRFSKILKMVVMAGMFKTRMRKKTSDVNIQQQALSFHLMNTLSRKIALCTVTLVICVPLTQVELWIDDDRSFVIWGDRLELGYARAIQDLQNNPEQTSTNDFQIVVQDMLNFYKGSTTFPFRIKGYPAKLNIHGREMLIPGEELLSDIPDPPRKEFVTIYTLTDKLHGDRNDDGWPSEPIPCVFSNTGALRKLKALENLVMIILVVIIIAYMSWDLQRNLVFLLDMEKNAEMSQKLLRKEILDAEELENLSAESRGVVEEMLLGGAGIARDFEEHKRTRKIHFSLFEAIVTDLPLDEERLNSWCCDILSIPYNATDKIIVYIFFDSSIGRETGREFTNVASLQLFIDVTKVGYFDVPYHNWFHACDVLHGVYRMLVVMECKKWLTNIEQYALLLAALGHDVGHMGFSNPFLIASRHELAMTYNDTSPLENMHCATLFKICMAEGSRMFEMFDNDTFKLARKVCVSTILHTDLTHHHQMVKQVEVVYDQNTETCKAQAKEPFAFSPKYEKDVLHGHHELWLQMILHQTDISGSCKPFPIARQWAERCLDEFFIQGDQELKLGLPVGLLNDRTKTSKPGCQHGFIMFVVSPLVLGSVRVYQVLVPLAEHLAANLLEWHNVWKSSESPASEDCEKRIKDVQDIRDKVNALAARATSPLTPAAPKCSASPPPFFDRAANTVVTKLNSIRTTKVRKTPEIVESV